MHRKTSTSSQTGRHKVHYQGLPHCDDAIDASGIEPPCEQYPRIIASAVWIRLLRTLTLNIFLELLFTGILRFYHNKQILEMRDRRIFNMASLLVAAALSIGIGYLFGEIGLMFRGRILEKSDNTIDEIAHIRHGTLGPYCWVVWSHIRRKTYTHGTMLAVFFVVGNILGRLSVGWIGLTYDVDDTVVGITEALRATWWPDVGESLPRQNVTSLPMGAPLLQDMMHILAGSYPLPDLDSDTDIEDWTYYNVPKLTRVSNVEDSKVQYTYYLHDEGGDPADRDNRTLVVSSQCHPLTNITTFLESYGFQSTTFYPITTTSIEYNRTFGWVVHSHPQNREKCGPSCIYLGFYYRGFPDTSNRSTEGYSCNISVDYTSSLVWGKQPHFAPSNDTLELFSSFLVGDGSNRDIDKALAGEVDLSTNQQWLGFSLYGGSRNDAMLIATATARIVAMVIQGLGDGLSKEDVKPAQQAPAGLLLVSWKWVIVVLGGLAIVQLVIIVIATLLVVGSLDLEDNLELLDGLFASQRFPYKNEPEKVANKPWVKRVVTSRSSRSGEAKLLYRFQGGTWRTLKAANSVSTEPPHQVYPRINISAILIRLLPVLALNLVLEGLFALILKNYSNKKILLGDSWRFFNFVSLLVAAALSMGIGYLLGAIGFMLRGRMLEKSDNTKNEIAHILHGTLGSYSLVAWSNIRRKTYTHGTMLVVLFVVGNALNRLSVSWVGLTYNVDITVFTEVGALNGTLWPNVGESVQRQDILVAPPMIKSVLKNTMRTVANAVPIPKLAEIETNSDGERVVKDWNFFNVPNLVKQINEAESTIQYTYFLQDEGGNSAVHGNRTLQVLGQCQSMSVRKFRAYDFQSVTFYPTAEQPEPPGLEGPALLAFAETAGRLLGWVLYSDPLNKTTCGQSCIDLGITFGVSRAIDTPYNDTDGYSCQLTVNYTSTVDWGNEPDVAPSTETLKLLSSFLVGNVSTNQVRMETAADIPINTNWLPPWPIEGQISTSIELPLYVQGHILPPMFLAGVFSRIVAIVIQRLGDSLYKKEILPPTFGGAGLLFVQWERVGMALGGLAIVQVVIIIVATFLTVGSLDLEYNLELLDGLFASHRFPQRDDPERVADKPWIKRVATSGGGEAELTYRFQGGTWGRLAEVDIGKRSC